MDLSSRNKALIAPLRNAMYNFAETGVKSALENVLAPDVVVHLPYPFGDLAGSDSVYSSCYAALFAAIPDLERRDYIVIAGTTDEGTSWVGCGGYYTGTMVAPWLDIPPTGHQVHMRFHEFFRIEQSKVVEVQFLWDIPELMMQAGAWPMAPSLGLEWHVPGPASHDGVVCGAYDERRSERSKQLILSMLDHMKKHPGQGGPEVMELDRFWHPRMGWYGPAGIGTARGISGFRYWHQIPFLRAMPDRGQNDDALAFHFIADGDYVAVTGWPNMTQTITNDGWLGIAPSGKPINICSLDFWRIENGLIRENWVLLDLLDIYDQIGVDVLGRMREFNKARVLGEVQFPVGASL